MTFLSYLISAGISLIFLGMVFIPLEKVFPARKNQKIFRSKWILDLSFFLGQYLVWGGIILYILTYFNFLLQSMLPESFTLTVKNQPYWLQVIEVIVLSDFIIYWGHRLQHRVNFLWRFHKVHHSAEHLDWLAAHREHPLDSVYTIGLINLPAFVLGFPLETLAGVIAFRGIWAIYIHSNVRLSIGFFKKLIGSPELHHWHHDKNRDAGNYANISPLMDLFFGTYVDPGHEPESFGIKENFPKNYIGQMIAPLLPDSFGKKNFTFREKKNPTNG